jgi:hypothetical protein
MRNAKGRNTHGHCQCPGHREEEHMRTPVTVTKLQVKSHSSPDVVRTPTKTRVEVVQLEGVSIGRFNCEPGRKAQ